MTLHCGGCGRDLDHSQFYPKYKDRPPLTRTDWSSRCVECVKKYKRDYYAKNAVALNEQRIERRYLNHPHYLAVEAARRLAKARDPSAILRRRAVVALDDRARYIHDRMTGWRASARRRKLTWGLSEGDVLAMLDAQRGLCHYLGVPLVLAPNDANTLSIDRVDPALGYTRSNVVLCGAAVNLMKLDMSIDEFKKVVAALHNSMAKW